MRFTRLALLIAPLFLTACGNSGSDPEGDAPPIADPNVALSILTTGTKTVPENQDLITVLDASKGVVWSISGTDSALVNVNYTWGTLKLNAAGDFENPIDDGKDNTYKFTVKAEDGAIGATESVTKDFTVTILDNTTERGSLVSDSTFSPFTRYLDVNKLRFFARSEVSNTFMESVASTFEAMVMNTTAIDYNKRAAFFTSLSVLNAYQRIGYIGPSNYSGSIDTNPGGSYTNNAIDYIWEETGKTETQVIGEVLEHLLHTITAIGFNTSFDLYQWAWNTTSSPLHLAMQQAISNGIYDVSSYADKKSDTAAYNKITATEYAYWLILAEWGYFEFAGKVETGYGTGNSEFTVGTSAEVESKNPLGHKLYLDTVAKILSVPDKDVIRSLF